MRTNRQGPRAKAKAREERSDLQYQREPPREQARPEKEPETPPESPFQRGGHHEEGRHGPQSDQYDPETAPEE